MTTHKTGLLGIVIVLVALACWLAFGRSAPQPPPSNNSGAGPQDRAPDFEKLKLLTAKARELQQSQEWCEARQLWREVADLLPSPTAGESEEVRTLRDEAEGNVAALKDRCADTKGPPPVTETAVTPSGDSPPAEIPEKDLLDYYPVGRTVRGVADLNITGRGSNERWFLKTDAHFAYRYEVVAETRVKEHPKRPLNRKIVIFEQRLADVTQLRAVSNVELQLRLPDSPILALVWAELEKNVLIHVPAYHLLRRAVDLINLADPGLKATLSRFKDELGLSKTDDVELAAQIESLAGMRFEIEYENGRGVTHIRVIGEQPLDRELLEQIATGSSLMLDYFVFPAVKEKQAGDEWTVRAEDVAGLFPVGYDARLRGEVTLRRNPDENLQDGTTVARLEVIGGEVKLERIERGGIQRAGARPTKGIVWYDPRDLVVRRAAAAWSGTTDWQSRDHLLFDTKNVRNLQVETYYEADRTDRPVVP